MTWRVFKRTGFIRGTFFWHIPTIQEELEKNGSPRAEFFTDEDRRAMRKQRKNHQRKR